MVDRATLWAESGLHPGQVVECAVTGHRDRYGVEVEIEQPSVGKAAFIDFVLLAEKGEPMSPDLFPAIGSRLSAVVVDFTPNGDLRLNARPSAVGAGET